MQSFRRYLAVIIAASMLPLGIAAVCNSIVDPFDAGGRLASDRFETSRNSSTSRRLKANQIANREIDFILLGSSRGELGFDPKGRALAPLGSGYNACLSGSNLFEARRVLEYALQMQRIERVFIGIELVMFSAFRTSVADFDDSRFASAEAENQIERWFQSKWGASVTRATFNMLIAGDDSETDATLIAGFRAAPAQTDAPRIMTEELKDYYRNSPEAYAGFQLSSDRADDLRAIVARCADEGIELYLFVPPIHVEHLELIDEVGLWDEFEEMKRLLARLSNTNADTSPDASPVHVWDFTSFEGVTTEPIPPSGSDRMRYYYEMSHFRPNVGDRLIATMLGNESLANPASESRLVATRMDRKTIEAHLDQLREARVSMREGD